MKGTTPFLLGVAAAVAGCASDYAARESAQGSINICQIKNAKELYVGKTVHVTARFKTDLRHYTFLQNESCGEDNTLRIGRARGNEEYEKIRSTWVADCEEKGSVGLCVIDELVHVVGTIRYSDQGGVVLDVLEIEAAAK